jgi:succinoglycan biosynthesis protein ExoM
MPNGEQQRLRIAVVVCTYKRNDPLRTLLRSVRVAAAAVNERAAVGVVIVDDNPDGAAKDVAAESADWFELGLEYRTSGQGNISLGRNIAVTTGAEMAEWVAMTDDDCEVAEGWLAAFLDAQQAKDADVVCGPLLLRAAPGSPSWITEQPFFEDAQFRHPDLAPMGEAATNNSMLRAALWNDNPDVRFLPELGVLGGEDMVFYRSFHRRAGAEIRFAADAIVYGNEPLDRMTFGYQMKSRFWLGNTEYVTNTTLGDASPGRLVVRAARRFAEAIARPIFRLAHGEPPQFRYAAACAARAAGLAAGPFGMKMRHH